MSEQVITFHKKTPVERVITIDQARDVVFSELKVLNVILTNACNLSCSYCFEQHKKSYGKFSLEQLKQMFDFLASCNDQPNKNFQFFGGEPLAQKKLILDFCRTYKDDLQKHTEQTRVAIVTNGLLLDEAFIEEYCGYDFTSMVLSLDTDNAETNRRELKQEDIDYLFKMIPLITARKDPQYLAIRCTINEESVPHLTSFMNRLYASGVRNFVIHPLIMGREQGVVEWAEGVWNSMYEQLVSMMDRHMDFSITWAEGVGVKAESNCMVGSDMIAMDASGDFSGCYFFTNLKEDLGHTLLGNLFEDKIYIDRYKQFQKAYTDMLEHEECKSCDLMNFCYQCPAGNAATGGKLFRPDGMCKRIVRLFLKIRQDINRKSMFQKINLMTEAHKQEGDIVFARAALHLTYRNFKGEKLNSDAIKTVTELPHHGKILAVFTKMLFKDIDPNVITVDYILDRASKVEQEVSALEFYRKLCQSRGIPSDFDFTGGMTAGSTAYFLSLAHLLVMDRSAFASKADEEHTRSRIFEL